MWKFQKEDGTFIDYAYVDGYHFGDRLLEGVMFKITIIPYKKKFKFKAEITPSAKAYFETLNQKLWLKRAEEHASDNDIFFETEGGKGDDIIIVDTETGKKCPNCDRY